MPLPLNGSPLERYSSMLSQLIQSAINRQCHLLHTYFSRQESPLKLSFPSIERLKRIVAIPGSINPQKLIREVEKLQAPAPLERPRVTVHILTIGLPYCGFSRERPCDWPKDHMWIHPQDAHDLLAGNRKQPAHEFLCNDCVKRFIDEA